MTFIGLVNAKARILTFLKTLLLELQLPHIKSREPGTKAVTISFIT